MSCKFNCSGVALILAVIAGVVLGVLYALGLVAGGIIFWVYLGIGVLALLAAPRYATGRSCSGSCKCFCANRLPLLISAIGAIIAASVGLIVALVTTATVVAIVLGVATFFVVWLLGVVVCLTNCLTQN